MIGSDDLEFLILAEYVTQYTGVIILSTYILTFFVIYSGLVTGLMSIDSMINVWCLVLCDKRCDNIYRVVFKCIAKGDVVDNYLESIGGTRSRIGSVLSSKGEKSSTKSFNTCQPKTRL